MDIAGNWELILRIGAFAAIFGSMAVFELWSPRLERAEMSGALKSRRWFTNLSMVILSSVLLRLIFPAAAVGTAFWAQAQGYGLFPALGINPIVGGLIAFILLDFAVWLEHVASHKIPLLWRIHRMHHADTGFDVTTALRFHPLEIILSMFWKAAIIVALGAPPLAVLLFEVVLNGTAMFNHSNIDLPRAIDRQLRKVLVTPDMHRVHHSVIRRETDSNYGFNFPFWDWIFRTYRDQPSAGHDAMDIGLQSWRDGRPAGLLWSLLLPFRSNDQKKLTGK
ncbi:MAG: sterol desaturase family protein [Rhizobiaceae bacterium]|nr:sterol desaturase family protein [Rhizobiaceae bacterium]